MSSVKSMSKRGRDFLDDEDNKLFNDALESYSSDKNLINFISVIKKIYKKYNDKTVDNLKRMNKDILKSYIKDQDVHKYIPEFISGINEYIYTMAVKTQKSMSLLLNDHESIDNNSIEHDKIHNAILKNNPESKTIQMTIQEFNDKLITVASGEDNNEYFGKEYIFILDTLDDTYANMNDTYILEVKNIETNVILMIENNDKFIKELNTYNKDIIIEIKYYDTIKKTDDTEINLKTDPVYNKIKESMSELRQLGGKRKLRGKSRKRKTHRRKTRSHKISR